MKSVSLPLIKFKSLGQWPFVLGIFNSSALLVGLGLFLSWHSAYLDQNWTNHGCGCLPGPTFLFWQELFPGSIEFKQLLGLLCVFVILTLSEAVYLTLRSQHSLLNPARLFLNWWVRSIYKNSAGLLWILSSLARNEVQNIYGIITLMSSGLWLHGQMGCWQSYSFSLLRGGINLPKLQQLKWLGYGLLFYALYSLVGMLTLR